MRLIIYLIIPVSVIASFILIGLDWFVHPPHITAGMMIIYCVQYGVLLTSIVTTISLVIRWLLIISLFKLTIDQLNRMLQRLERSMEIIILFLHIHHSQSSPSPRVTVSLLSKFDRLLIQFASYYRLLQGNTVTICWCRVAFILMMCYLIVSTNFVFCNVFLLTNPGARHSDREIRRPNCDTLKGK